MNAIRRVNVNERVASRKSRRMKSYFIILVTDIVILFAQHVLVLPKPVLECVS